jgi:polyisoprenoid-binding protein YceI
VTRYRIDPERSAVLIDASSSVHPIRTRTNGLEGFVELRVDSTGHIDVDATISGELSLEVERLKSGNPLEDRELRRRIDARRFPTINGRITEVHAVAGDGDGRYRVRGDVTFRGVTNAHEDDVTLLLTDEGELKIDGRSTFDVRDFGMQPPKILMLRVHPEVTVAIDAVATRDVAPQGM